MSPTVFRYKNYRFFFFSREEPRMHVHVVSPDGEAKVWIETKIDLDRSVGYNHSQVTEILQQVKDHKDEIENHWREHFSCGDQCIEPRALGVLGKFGILFGLRQVPLVHGSHDSAGYECALRIRDTSVLA